MTQKLFKQVYVTPRLKIIATQMMRVSYKCKARLTLRQHLGSPQFFGGVRIADLLSFLYCVVFVFVMCLVRLMLPLTPDCPFLNEPSDSSDVYYEYVLFII
jgi:hypothetical protein